MEKTEHKTGTKHKAFGNSFKNYLMLALSTVLIILGVYFLVSFTILTMTRHKFHTALEQGNPKLAALHAGKISDRYETARNFLDAVDKQLDFKRSTRAVEDIAGHRLHSDWQKIKAASAKADNLFEKNQFDASIDAWSTAISLCRELRSQKSTVSLVTEPPVTNAVLRVYAANDDLIYEGPIQPDETNIAAIPGEYEFSIIHTNHSQWTTNVLVAADQEEPRVVEAELPPLKGGILIQCTPVAEVWRNGTLICKTGDRIQLPVGKHVLTLRREGYESKKIEIEMQPRAEEKITLELEKQEGALRIAVDYRVGQPEGTEFLPENAEISLNDGEFKQVRLPKVFSALPIGDYEIDLRVAGCRPVETKTVEIEPDAVQKLVFEIQPLPVPVVFKVENARDVVIYKDNSPIGSADEPIELMPNIEHELRLMAAGYEDMAENIRLPLGTGSTNVIHVEMEKIKPYRLRIGTSRNEVLRRQGRPDKIRNYSEKYIYEYAESEIIFSRKDDRVIQWDDSGGNLQGLSDR